MKDAPPASTKEPYKCGEGDKNFYEPPDSTDYNQHAKCSDCFTKSLQVRIISLLDFEYLYIIRFARRIPLDDHQPEKPDQALWFV